MDWYLQAFKKYADFTGRARRKEYWMFILFNVIAALVALILDNILGIAFGGVGYGPLYLIYIMAIIIPSISIAVRRLHDIGKSGWMFLVSFIPLIGGIWLIILLCKDSQPGENEYGPNPKEVTA